MVEWCGGAITLREARRFRKLVNIPQWSDSAAALRGVTCTACGRIIEVSKVQAEAAARQVGPDLR